MAIAILREQVCLDRIELRTQPGIIRMVFQVGTAQGGGVRAIAQDMQHGRGIGDQRTVVRCDAQTLRKILQRLTGFALLPMQDAEIVQGIRVAGVQAQGHSEQAFRAGEIALCETVFAICSWPKGRAKS